MGGGVALTRQTESGLVWGFLERGNRVAQHVRDSKKKRVVPRRRDSGKNKETIMREGQSKSPGGAKLSLEAETKKTGGVPEGCKIKLSKRGLSRGKGCARK